MPKQNKPPKYCKMGKYALVYHQGRKIYLGLYGTPESRAAYNRLLAEIEANPTAIPLSNGEKKVTVSELAAEFLDYAKANINPTDYTHYQTAILDFLEKFYGDKFPVDDFKPRCLKLVRDEMVKSCRFCRNTINKYTRQTLVAAIVGITFRWMRSTNSCWRWLSAPENPAYCQFLHKVTPIVKKKGKRILKLWTSP